VQSAHSNSTIRPVANYNMAVKSNDWFKWKKYWL